MPRTVTGAATDPGRPFRPARNARRSVAGAATATPGTASTASSVRAERPASVKAATRRSARPIVASTVRSNRCVEPGVDGERRHEHRDADRDPERRQQAARGPGGEAAPRVGDETAHRAVAAPRLQADLREALDERGGRVVVAAPEVDLVAHPAVADHEHPVGVGRRLGVVGHEHDRLAAVDARAP